MCTSEEDFLFFDCFNWYYT